MEKRSHKRHLGTVVHTPWSDVAVAEVLLTFVSSRWTFHGVKGAILDRGSWDWPSPESLLWAVEDGRGLKFWPPWVHAADSLREHEREIEAVIGHHEHLGEVYVAVKWAGRECPTWEIEYSLDHSQKLLTYWTSMLQGS